MKKILDKPYKVYLIISILLIVSIVYSLMIFKETMTAQKSEPSIAEAEVIGEVAMVTVEVPKETVELPPEPVVEQQPIVPPSRGGAPIKQFTQREMIEQYVRQITENYNIDPLIIMSLIETESTYNPQARNGNCLGLMQVSSYWHRDRAARLGVTDFYDPYGNILVGVDYISDLLKEYKDIRLVLMMYNMNHDTALKMYRNGQISEYARTILTRAEGYKKGE